MLTKLSHKWIICIISLLLAFVCVTANAESDGEGWNEANAPVVSDDSKESDNSPRGYLLMDKPTTLELFMGANLNYRDMTFDQVYDVLVQLTPGIKWNPGFGWQMSAQALFAVLNTGYAKEDWTPRLNIATVSKEFNWKMLDLKVSGGFFSMERYGLDIKAMCYPLEWFAVEAQLGCTGYVSTYDGWKASYMKQILAVCGMDFYLRQWQTQIRIRGGRFLYGDLGAVGEVMRHFNHCSVGVYAQTSNKFQNVNGGFKVVMMIPPYRYKSRRVVRVRPASNFRLTYNMRGDGFGCKTYITDPEENERNHWFVNRSTQWEKR